ncbi:MAG: TonB family protein [Gemmatimonas sp.]|nr:TonB family protein [Gemmatimonas sp.]
MIVLWMLYGLLVAAMLGMSAALAEGALLRWDRATRWLWVAALLLLPTVPLVSMVVPGWGRTLAEGGVILGPITALAGGVIGGEAAAVPLWPGDGFLLAAWLLASLTMAAFLARSGLLLRSMRRGWQPAEVSGHRVWLSRSCGPAVVGFLGGEIVLPEWIDEIEPGDRELLVAHEAEHIRSRDPLLLLFGTLAVVAVPWNPFVWWQVARLRTAMEVDCDRRLLGAGADLRTYGDLLLQVVARRSILPPVATAFAHWPSQLERRVRVMTSTSVGRSTMKAIGAAVAAVLLVLGSCRLEQPTSLAPSIDAAGPDQIDLEALRAEPTFTPFTERPELIDRASYARALQEGYPDALAAAGIGGTTILWVLVDADGAVGNLRLVSSSGYDDLDQAAQAAMRQATFTPARNDGVAVPVWIQIPVTFATM